MDWYRQVVFAERDDATAKFANFSFAPAAFFKIEANIDAKAQNKITDLLIGIRSLGKVFQAIEHCHEFINLALW